MKKKESLNARCARARKGLFGVMLLVGLVTHGVSPALGDGEADWEYKLKAECLYRCMQLVDWPPNALSAASPTLTLGILGQSPVGSALDVYSDKSIQGKKLVIKHLTGVQEAAGCQAVFVCSSEQKNLKNIVEELKLSGTLTSSDIPGFAKSGGIIGITVKANHPDPQINRAAAKREKISIRSELLTLCTVIRE